MGLLYLYLYRYFTATLSRQADSFMIRLNDIDSTGKEIPVQAGSFLAV